MLFKSKLEHTDPDVRRQYVEEMAADDSQLLQVAQSDPHPEVRASAVTRIIDLQVVLQLSQKDAEERIRNLATARLQSLMSGSENPAPSLDTRLGFLDGAADQRLIRFVARSAREPELRKVAVNRLLAHQDQPLV
ncbi:MAG: hypothetical protein HKM98_02405, partial [Gammaproteobacteria bacterium]|nr:hypothetical protein [Gammaproteobacteria bacterium]